MRKIHYDSHGNPLHVEPVAGLSVRSHQSDAPHVAAVCRHSGHYLTRAETNTQRQPFLHAQHDYPGFAELDREFAGAAHSRSQQHFVWDSVAIQGWLWLLCGLLLAATGLVAFALQLSESAAISVSSVAFVAISLLLGVGLLSLGAWRVQDHDRVYHRGAIGQPPDLPDFPLLRCSFAITAEEYLHVNLGNTEPHPIPIVAEPAMLKVELYPQDSDKLAGLYRKYQRIYGAHVASPQLYAGMLSLENLSAVAFTGLELAHRLPLRAPVPDTLAKGSYVEGRLATIEAPYDVLPQELYKEQFPDWRFPIECVPELRANNSYDLNLRFVARWGDAPVLECALEECRLEIPSELRPVGQVTYGRYDAGSDSIVWRNLWLRQRGDRQALDLRASFGRPLLDQSVLMAKPTLHGSYRCRVFGLISGMRVSPERLWNALGWRANDGKTKIDLRCSTLIEGDLTIDLRRMLQEHEHVSRAALSCDIIPDSELVKQILEVLSEYNVSVQRVERAAPRLDPAGTVRLELCYWDITGRYYAADMLSSIDVHIVVAGAYHIAPSQSVPPPSRVDVYVRCLHDPRDCAGPMRAEVLRGALEQGFQQRLAAIPLPIP